MKRFCVVIMAGMIWCGMVPAAPVFEPQDIFPLVSKHVHGSSLVECRNGDLLACWFQGSGERTADDVVVNGARLKKGAKDWSPVFLMADTPGFPDCNPVLFIDRHKRLWLFWIPVLAHRWECCQLKYRISQDYQGEGPPIWSWQDVIILDPGEAFSKTIEQKFDELKFGEGMWGEYAPPYRRMIIEAAKDPYKRQTGWMTRIHPFVLPSHRILLPLYSDGFNISLVAISDDDGKNWRASSPIVGLGPTQPTLVRRKDGAIVAYLRDSGDAPGRVQVSTSRDDGESWSAAVDTDIPNPDSSLEVVALKDGHWLMIHNDTEEGRHRLTASLSDDEGATWKWRRVLEPPARTGGREEAMTFAYPSVIQTPDGLVHMTYSYSTAKGNSIRHAILNTAGLKSGD